MAYEDFKNLPKRTASDNVFYYKAFNINKNQKYDGCQCELASTVHHFFIKSLLVLLLKVKLHQTSY